MHTSHSHRPNNDAPCTDCDGEGYLPRVHRDEDLDKCEACDGTGHGPCANCGDPVCECWIEEAIAHDQYVAQVRRAS